MSDDQYVTKSGKVLTDADIEALSEEAEHGNRRLEYTLMGTPDATVWASEFCRIFDGKEIVVDPTDRFEDMVNESTMVTWFANAIEKGRDAGSAEKPKEGAEEVHIGTWYAFLYFYHLDHSNAAFHCNVVRFSPITFRLAEFLADRHLSAPHPELGEQVFLRYDSRLVEVLAHSGLYREDKGR